MCSPKQAFTKIFHFLLMVTVISKKGLHQKFSARIISHLPEFISSGGMGEEASALLPRLLRL